MPDPGKDHLGYPLFSFDGDSLRAKINESHFYLTAVVGVNSAGGIYYRKAGSDGKSTPGPDLEFITMWQGYCKTCGNKTYFPRMQVDVVLDRCSQIHACRLPGDIMRKRKINRVGQAFYLYDYRQSFQ